MSDRPLPQARVFASASEFRAWLEENHDKAAELWVGYYKKGVPKTAMTYPESVDEALCFGWIDGLARRIDDEVTALRFTPRRRGSNWSAVNLERFERLDRQGRVQPAGRRAFEDRRQDDSPYSYENAPRQLSPDYEAQLRANADAWRHWQSRPPGYRRQASFWVMSARREETRLRRLAALIADSAAERPIKPLSY